MWKPLQCSVCSVTENHLFQFFVRATDHGVPPQYSDVPVDVYVMGAMDYPPRFHSDHSEFFVYEDRTVGSVVAAVTAESNQSLAYVIVPGELPNTNNPMKFDIDNDGKISIIEPLDREETEKFELTIKAETETSPSLVAFTKVTIQIRDRNDNSPQFESNPYMVSIVENADIGSQVVQIIAHDADIGANADITYGFAVEDAHLANVFAINSETGWITTLVELDRETEEDYAFGIVARDRGSDVQLSDMTTVRVTVLDYNDCAPVFSEEVYEGSVNEDALPGTIILTVQTSDQDLPPNNEATYSLVSGDPRGQFNIRSTGEIYVNKALDREVTPVYDLGVAASDGVFVTTTTLRLSILDANDNAPVCGKVTNWLVYLTDTSYSPSKTTIEPVLKNHPIVDINMISQGRWSLVTGSVTLKCRTYQEYLVFQDRWSLMAVVSQDRLTVLLY